MAFCREMHHGIASLHHVGYRWITNVQTDKLHPRTFQDRSQITEIPGVGELIHDDDVVICVLLEHVQHEIGTDKTGAAGDDYFHGVSFSVVLGLRKRLTGTPRHLSFIAIRLTVAREAL